MKDLLLLLHDDRQRVSQLSPSDMEAVVARYSAWAEGLAGQGRLAAGHKLRDEGGKQLRRNGGSTQVTDGPYAEVADVVAGLFVIRAADYAQACALAADCPHLEYGWIELREIEPT
jgi:hypothetical protein